MPEGYEEFKDTLLKMNDLAHLLRKNKIERGYIDFDIEETKILAGLLGIGALKGTQLHREGVAVIDGLLLDHILGDQAFALRKRGQHADAQAQHENENRLNP